MHKFEKHKFKTNSFNSVITPTSVRSTVGFASGFLGGCGPSSIARQDRQTPRAKLWPSRWQSRVTSAGPSAFSAFFSALILFGGIPLRSMCSVVKHEKNDSYLCLALINPDRHVNTEQAEIADILPNADVGEI